MWPISLNLIFTSNKKLPSLAHTHTSCQANIHYLVLQHVQSSNAELWRLTKQQRIVFTQLERVRLFYFISWTFAHSQDDDDDDTHQPSNCDEERQQLCYPNKMKPSIKFYHTLLFSHPSERGPKMSDTECIFYNRGKFSRKFAF